MTFTIPLTKEKFAIVDDEDAELAGFSWCCKHVKHRLVPDSFYAIHLKRIAKSSAPGKKHKCYYLSRMVMEKVVDRELVTEEWVDHINHNTLDCRRSNLRICTSKQNKYNLQKRKGTFNKYIGTLLCFATLKWRAMIRNPITGKKEHLGRFLAEIEAAKAYDVKAKEYHGEFAVLNFPEEAF